MKRTRTRSRMLDTEQRHYLQVASAKRREFYRCNAGELDDIDLTLALAWLAAWWTQRVTDQARRAISAPEAPQQPGLFETIRDEHPCRPSAMAQCHAAKTTRQSPREDPRCHQET